MTVPMIVRYVHSYSKQEKRNITPFSGGTPTFQVLQKLYYSYLSSRNVLIVSLVNTLQGVSLLQSPNTLILLHLTRTDPVLQLDQFVL
jgi:hypothetical protein